MEPRPIPLAASQSLIEEAWDQRDALSPAHTPSDLVRAVDEVLEALGHGQLKIVDKHQDTWQVNAWLKKAILLSFRIYESKIYAPSQNCDWQRWFDKIPQKFAHWTEIDFQSAGLRALPGGYVRKSAFIGPRTVLMPCFINMGAHVGEGTMIDTWSTVGSCAYVGKNCHISGGVGIGGVLEPVQSRPVIIEDHCFIGARSEIAEGVIVEEGAVIAMGVFLGASTKIVDRATGEIFYGRVPAYSVVVPGTLPGRNHTDPGLACAVIVKRVDAQTRAKTSLNDLLRDDAA
jgi:2,3,4,5-tetrahydropyridine-2-carboxylate N-succinyltransferase